MTREIISSCVALIAGLAISSPFEVDFNEKTFTKGIPEDWVVAENPLKKLTFANPPSTVDEKKVLTILYNNAEKGEYKIIYCTNAVSGIECDNICMKIPVYLAPKLTTQPSKIDQLQAVISTDGGTSFIGIGEPLNMQEMNRTEGLWVTNTVSAFIDGLSSHEVLVGLKAIGYGTSLKSGYVGGVSADFVASATPSEFKFLSGDGDECRELDSLLPGEDAARISVNVPGIPEGRIT